MELINREAVLDTIPKIICMQRSVGKTLFAEFIEEWVSNIKTIPTIESRPKGKWIRITQGAIPEQFICPFCHRTVEDYEGVEEFMSIRYPYCHCGADMRGDEQ